MNLLNTKKPPKVFWPLWHLQGFSIEPNKILYFLHSETRLLLKLLIWCNLFSLFQFVCDAFESAYAVFLTYKPYCISCNIYAPNISQGEELFILCSEWCWGH